jgi:hypothetical protein
MGLGRKEANDLNFSGRMTQINGQSCCPKNSNQTLGQSFLNKFK